MFVSASAGLGFVHVQKTGGMTVDRFLNENFADLATGGTDRHSTWSQGLERHPEWEELWTFGVVRNPWARMASWWKMLENIKNYNVRRGTLPEKNKWWRDVVQTCPDFEWFVLEGTERWGRLRRPQHQYLTHRGREVDFIARTERLDDDLQVVARQFGIDWTAPDQRNVSGGGSNYREQYTPAMRDRIGELFAADVDRFGYEF